MLLQDQAVLGFAESQDPVHINGRQIELRSGRQVGQRLKKWFASDTAICVQRNRVYPSDNHTFVPELSQAFPTLGPCRLRGFLRRVAA
jgi:hypothetical protein